MFLPKIVKNVILSDYSHFNFFHLIITFHNEPTKLHTSGENNMVELKINTQKKHEISPYLYMQFIEPLGVADTSVDAAWDFAENRWHPAVIEKVRELSPTMIRFGGAFASYYHWKEGIGPRNSRIPMFNHCWGGIYIYISELLFCT